MPIMAQQGSFSCDNRLTKSVSKVKDCFLRTKFYPHASDDLDACK